MNIDLMLLGAIAMASFTVSLFFLRSWKTTRDRFFFFFALSFGLEGVTRILLGLTDAGDERQPFIYLLRLCAFLIIIFAILDKNLSRGGIKKPIDNSLK